MIMSSPKFKKIKTCPCSIQQSQAPNGTDNSITAIATATTTTTTSAAAATNRRRMEPGDYLPSHLRRYVQHSHGDFFVSSSFEPRLIAQLMYEGFLPIATPRYLVPKLHKERCVIYPLNRLNCNCSGSGSTPSISAVHISKSVKKRAKNFLMTINQAFDQVVQGCHDQHGIGWLYPPIVEAFRVIHEGSTTVHEWKNSFPVFLYSIEVWNATNGKLAGGELGYAVGTLYTSLTGFACEDSAGSVQLAALGQFLWSCGFDLWDLGMKLDYKSKLGAEDMNREDFVARVKDLRGKPMGLMKMEERTCCKSLITNITRTRRHGG